MKDRLTTLWKLGETKSVARVFEEYMSIELVLKQKSLQDIKRG